MNHYMYVVDIMKDILKIIDYLKVRSPLHITSYFCVGDRNQTFT